MKPFEQQNYYELLEVPVTASEADIRAAYERAMEVYAPDSLIMSGIEDPRQVEELRERITEAMEMLTEPELRDEYDRTIGLPRRVAAVSAVTEVTASMSASMPLRGIAVGAPAAAAELSAQRQEERAGPEHGAAAPLALVRRAGEAVAAARDPEGETPLVRVTRASGAQLAEAESLAQDSAIATAEASLAQVVAKAREARPKPIEIPEDAEFNGELLRRVREGRGLTVQALADRTRISSRHLENVEADRYASLPAVVYLRGMLMSVARELGLDPLRVAKSYLALASRR